MTVPEGKRTKSKLDFHTKAIELASYTKQICNNNEIFPKRDRWIIANRLVEASITILVNLVKANGIFVNSWETYEERLIYQKLARDATLEMLALMDFAYNVYPISSKRMEYWSKLITEERKLILAWMKSDRDRFTALYKGSK